MKKKMICLFVKVGMCDLKGCEHYRKHKLQLECGGKACWLGVSRCVNECEIKKKKKGKRNG